MVDETDAEPQPFPTSLIIFDVRGVRVALDAARVQRVADRTALTPLPRAPAHIPGLMLIGARALPLLDLGEFLAFPSRESDEDEHAGESRLLIVREGQTEVGIEARRITMRTSIEGVSQRRPQLLREPSMERFCLGELDVDGQPVIAIDLDAVLEGARARG